MISLQKLFGKNDIFYDLLEASAAEALHSVQALGKLLTQPVATQNLDELILTRRKDKKITEQINEELCRTFVTELEREDIEALSNVLYKIPKTVEKIAERVIITGGRLQDVDFSRHLQMMEEATITVLNIVKELRKKLHLERVKDMNAKLQHIEGEADKLMMGLLKELYAGHRDPIQTIMLKDLYELMEKVYDRCRDAGNVVSHIVLKYS
ncbi:MAG TPA: pit accessory protein [Verrucomicrobiales bacterium]|nr:pit accessory protein [Verrucomicrobiales bacterium]